MGKIFISYAREDQDIAEEIHNFFKNNGHDAWIDSKNLVPGQEWQIEIEKAIQSSDIFIACLSTQSVDKVGYVQVELQRALEVAETMPEGRTYIIPIRLDECAMPRSLSKYHCADWFSQGVSERLLQAVDIHSQKQEEKSNEKFQAERVKHLNQELEIAKSKSETDQEEIRRITQELSEANHEIRELRERLNQFDEQLEELFEPDYCEICEPGEEYWAARFIEWGAQYPLTGREELVAETGYCNYCTSTYIKCGVCGNITGIDGYNNDGVQCLGECGVIYREHQTRDGIPEIEVSFEENDEELRPF